MRLFGKRRFLRTMIDLLVKEDGEPSMALIVAVYPGGQVRVQGAVDARQGVSEPFFTDFRELGDEVNTLAGAMHAQWKVLADQEEKRTGGNIRVLPQGKKETP